VENIETIYLDMTFFEENGDTVKTSVAAYVVNTPEELARLLDTASTNNQN